MEWNTTKSLLVLFKFHEGLFPVSAARFRCAVPKQESSAAEDSLIALSLCRMQVGPPSGSSALEANGPGELSFQHCSTHLFMSIISSTELGTRLR